VTHVVAPTLKRVAKVLAAMAAGAWVVSTQFLTASHSAHKLVDPVQLGFHVLCTCLFLITACSRPVAQSTRCRLP